MRLKLLWTLWLSLILSLVYSQPDKDKDKNKNDPCEKFIEQNRILTQLKMDLANNRDSFQIHAR